jgi:hypothetical protein
MATRHRRFLRRPPEAGSSSALVEGPHGYRVDAERGLVYGLRGRPVGNRDSGGHIQVDGRSRGLGLMSAHRIVWEAVHGPIPDGLVINHLNGDPADNRLENLEAVPQRENVRHAYRTGLKSNVGELHPSHVLTVDQVREIRRRYQRYSRHANARALSEEFGVGRRTIAEIVEGNTWAHVGEDS